LGHVIAQSVSGDPPIQEKMRSVLANSGEIKWRSISSSWEGMILFL
jgi:hypothetical protein